MRIIRYLFRKILYSALVLFGVVTLVFVLFNVIPGDPARMMLGQRADAASVEAINKDLGRDLPLYQQYFLYVNDLSPISIHHGSNEDHFLFLDDDKYDVYGSIQLNGDWTMVAKLPYFRRSYQSGKKVSVLLSETLPATLVLASSAIIIALILGVFLGIIAALNKDSWLDRAALYVSVLGMSAPSFFVGIVVAWMFGFVLHEYTHLEMTGSLYEVNELGEGKRLALHNLILPAFTLGIRPLSVVMQLSRNALLDVYSQDYIRTARAKGLTEFMVLFGHALRNAMNPVVTAVSGWFASMLAGAVFVEMVFAWKGIGWELVSALEKFDLPVVMGAVLIIAFIFVVINILVDVIYTWLDPRISL